MKRSLIIVCALFLVVGTSLAAIINEGFEASIFPPTDWSLSGTASLWTRYAVSAYGLGNGSAKADFYSVSSGYQDLVSYVCTPTAEGDSLCFDHAYAAYSGSYIDSLTIWTSANGGGNWDKLIGLRGGPSGPLNTGGTTTSPFVPNSTQWATKKYALPAGTDRVRFRAHTAYGNNLYVDNIEVIYPQQDHDVGVYSIVAPVGQQSTSINPAVIVKNHGTFTETFQTFIQVSLNASVVYRDSLEVVNLAAEETTLVQFAEWTPPAGEVYAVTSWTLLGGDMISGNDTAKSSFDSYNFQRKVFGIDFTATWCTWCPWHQVAWDRLKKEAGDSLCMIAVHSSASGDSFYFAACGTLASYYGVPGYPTSVMDGIDFFVGSDTAGAGTAQYNAFRASFDERKIIKTPFSLTITGTNNKAGLISAEFSYPGSTPLPLTVRGAIVEASKYSVWPSPSHQLRQDSVLALVRGIFPSAAGDTFTLTNGTKIKEYPFSLNPGWDTTKISFVVWAEKRGQKENYQSDEIHYSELVSGVSGEPQVGNGCIKTLLHPCAPNPAAGRTVISFQLAAPGRVSLGVYDVAGRLVRTLESGPREAGRQSVTWDGRDNFGRTAANGVYFYRLTAGDYTATRKLTIVR
jgi:hypothetical protein